MAAARTQEAHQKRVQKIVEELPPTAPRRRQVASTASQQVDAMFDPKRVVETTFGFVEELLAVQKDFALRVVDAMSVAR